MSHYPIITLKLKPGIILENVLETSNIRRWAAQCKHICKLQIFYQTTSASRSAAPVDGASSAVTGGSGTAAKERPDELNIKQLAQVRDVFSICKIFWREK